jgi:RNA polymerase sigma-70 factor, ECF subfamily
LGDFVPWLAGRTWSVRSQSRNKLKRQASLRGQKAGAILSAPAEDEVELFDFDQAYFRRLQQRDQPTESHFASYFGDLVRIKLRARLLSANAIEDIQQETFVRVFAAIRSESGVREPAKLGAFVNSVCNNVLLEFYRSSSRNPQEPEERREAADQTVDLDGFLASKQTCEQVRQALEQLPEKDRRLLKSIFLEDKDKEQVCREFGVGRDYLRVLLHRAKQSFKQIYENRAATGWK